MSDIREHIGPLIEKIVRLVEISSRLTKNVIFEKNLIGLDRFLTTLKSLNVPLEILKRSINYHPSVSETVFELHALLNKCFEFFLFFDQGNQKGHKSFDSSENSKKSNLLNTSSVNDFDEDHCYDRLARYQKQIHLLQHKLWSCLDYQDVVKMKNEKDNCDQTLLVQVQKACSVNTPLSIYPLLPAFKPFLSFGLPAFPNSRDLASFSTVSRQSELMVIKKALEKFRLIDFNNSQNQIESEIYSKKPQYSFSFSQSQPTPSLPPQSVFSFQLPVIIVISGPPGIGKTTFAHYISLKLAEDYQYQDYRVYFDFNRYGVYYMHSDGTQNCMKSCLSPEISGLLAPGSWRIEKVRERYRSLFREKKGIIILDNVKMEDDIKSLLPFSSTFPLAENEGYIMIICMDTVEQTFIETLPICPLEKHHFAHCVHQELTVLDSASSRLLLAKVAQTFTFNLDFSQKEHIQLLCNIGLGMPILLRMVGFFAGKHIEDFIVSSVSLGNKFQEQWLKELDVMGIEMRQVMTQCFQMLPVDSQVVLLLLRVFPSIFDLEAANAIIGKFVCENSRPLPTIFEELYKSGFLQKYQTEKSTKSHQYYLHSLIRKLSRLLVKNFPSGYQVSGNSFIQVQYSFVDYYSSILDQVEDIYNKEGPTSAMILFDEHVQHIQAAIIFTLQSESRSNASSHSQSNSHHHKPIPATVSGPMSNREREKEEKKEHVKDQLSTSFENNVSPSNRSISLSLLKPRPLFRYRLSSRQRRRMYNLYYDSTLSLSLDQHQITHAQVLCALGDLHTEVMEVEYGLKSYQRALDCCAGNYANIASKNEEAQFHIQRFPSEALPLVAYILHQIGCSYASLENHEDSLKYHERSLNVYAWIGDLSGRGRVHCDMGLVYKMSGNISQAIKHYQEAVKVYQRLLEENGWKYSLPAKTDKASKQPSPGTLVSLSKTENPHLTLHARQSIDGLACALNNLAVSYEIKDDFQASIILYKESKNLSLKSKNIDILSFSLLGLGHCYERANLLIDSVNCLINVCYFQTFCGCLSTLGDVYQQLGVTYCRLGEYQMSRDYYLKCRTIRLELRSVYLLTYCLNHLGLVYHNLLDFHAAFQCLRESIAINKASHNKSGVAYAMDLLGDVLIDLEQYLNALQCYTKSKNLKKELKDAKGLARVCHNIAFCYEKLRLYDKSISFYLESRDFYRNVGDYEGLAGVLSDIAHLFHGLGDFSTSNQLLTQARTIYIKLGIHCASFFNAASLIRQMNKLHLDQHQQTLEDYFVILLKRQEKNQDHYSAAVISKELGDLYFSKGNLLKTREYMEKSRKLFEQLIKKGQNRSSSNKYLRAVEHCLGNVYKEMNEITLATQMYEKSISGNDSKLSQLKLAPYIIDETQIKDFSSTILFTQ